MCEGELLEADGELDVAGPNYVLDLELSKLGLPPATPRSGAALRVPRDFFIRAGNWYHAPQKRPSRWLPVPPGLPLPTNGDASKEFFTVCNRAVICFQQT